MSSEDTGPRPLSTGELPASADGRELQELRKEVVEARNLVIKTDNLLKNMHAEIRKIGVRQDEFASRRFWSSVTAYLLFAIIAIVGAFAAARSDSAHEREVAAQNEARAKQLTAQMEQLQKQEAARREVSERAAKTYERLGAEKEGPGLNQAMSNAMHIDRQMLTPLEAKALEDRAASLKSQVAQGALERGNRNYRLGDWKGAATELGRYAELNNGQAEPLVNFHLGHSRAMTRDWAGVVRPMEAFLKSAGGTKTAQTAGYYLGMAYEEQGSYGKAAEAYQRAAALYPGSDIAPAIRAKLRRIPSLQAAAATAAQPAAAPGTASRAPVAPPATAPAAASTVPVPR